jgi:hypothetical protein
MKHIEHSTLFAYFLGFMSIYAPIIKFENVNFDLQFSFFLVSMFIVSISSKEKMIPRIRMIVVPLTLIFLTFCYSTFANVFFNPDITKLDSALRIIRIIITYLGCWVIARYLVTIQMDVLEIIFWSTVFHGLIMLLQFVSIDFRDFSYQYTVDSRALLGARYEYSMAGLTNGGGAQLSVYQSFGSLIGIHLLGTRKEGESWVWLACGLGATVVSIFLSGRSGLLSLLLFGPIVALRNTSPLYIRTRFVKTAVIASLVALVASIFVLLGSFGDDESFDSVSAIALRSNDVFLLGGEDSAYSELATAHLFLPDDLDTFIFGNPRLIAKDQNGYDRLLDSDIGYVRLLFGYGVLGSTLHYLFYIYLIMTTIKLTNRGYSRDYAFLVLVMCIAILFFNWKEIFVFTRMGFSQVLLAFFALILLGRDSATQSIGHRDG